jgi:hypothetical protein
MPAELTYATLSSGRMRQHGLRRRPTTVVLPGVEDTLKAA